MTSALTSPFHGLPIDEAVPLAMEVHGVSRSSVLQGRRKIRFQPQSGTTANSGSIIQFVLSDSTGLLDVNSMVLSCTMKVNGASSAEPAWMDEGPSFVRRCQVICNGSLVDDVDNAHRAFNLEVLSSVGQDFYDSEGSFMNLWKFNNATSIATPPFAHNNVAGALTNQFVDLSGNGLQCAWPVGLIAPSLRTNKYWPLRSMGELVLQFTCAQDSEAIWSPLQSSTNPTYSLSNIYLEAEICVPHPAYSSLLDHTTQMESEPGLVIPVETILVSQGTAISSQGENSIVTSRATTNLRQVMVAAQATDGQNAYSYPSVSCFPDAGFQAIQWRVGSLYFPSQPADTLARAAMTTYAAFGEPASTDKASVWNRMNYDTTTQVGGAVVYVNRPAAGGLTSSTPAATLQRFPYSDFAPKSYCFDSYKNSSDPLDADGKFCLCAA